jgi:CheY-like chemotaxis protein
MDEYDSDDAAADSAGGDTIGADYASSVTRSLDIGARHKIALSKAKSFRGQKLYSLIQTPSSVFDCPTPLSRDESSMEMFFSASDSEQSASAERCACSSENTLGSIEEVPQEHARRIDVTAVASLLIPDMPMDYLPPAAPGSPRQYVRLSVPPGGKSHRQMLSIETMTLSGVTAAADCQRQGLSSLSAADAAGDSTQTGTSEAATDGAAADSVSRRNQEYASLTEKNVNLNILRTASSDVARALQMPGRKPSFMRQTLSEVLSACKILVVDGESTAAIFSLGICYNVTIPNQILALLTDAPSNRKLLSMLLRRAGFGTVDLVEDGQAAVNYCMSLSAEEQPSIIFMDNTMPKLVRNKYDALASPT